MRPRARSLLAVLAVILVGSCVLATAHGAVRIPYGEVARAALGSSKDPLHVRIVQQVRLPRLTAAALVGAALGGSGAVMQSVFRNPMADPGVIGVSAGGALGGALALVTGLVNVWHGLLPACAFAGALAAVLAVYWAAHRLGRGTVGDLLLAGLVISIFLGGILSLILALIVDDLFVLRETMFWLAGGLEARSWFHVRVAAGPILGGLAVLVALARPLNLLLLNDEEAWTLGVRVGLVRGLALLAAALATGAAVAISGVIGFVGLIVPNALRLLSGPDNRVLIPAAALGGGAFLVLADTLARVILEPAELRVGIITACVGAPVFLWLLARQRRGLDVPV
ncbi:MAG: iron chelate uptake ABC transporter family permease subunit [Bacillota bacterium]